MNAVDSTASNISDVNSLQDYLVAATDACQRIAPVWPLDQAIAVNPWWQLRAQPIMDVSAQLQALGKVHCLMPKAYYQQHWLTHTINAEHLALACQSLTITASQHTLVTYLDKPLPNPHWLSISDLLDAASAGQKKMAWHDEIIHQISQFCGVYFTYPQAVQTHSASNADQCLYQSWLNMVQQDRGIEILMGQRGLNQQFRQLPQDPQTLIAMAAQELGCTAAGSAIFAHYCHALLLDINGWASWLAYGVWQDKFEAKANQGVEQLLAIRLAWELVLWRHTASQGQSPKHISFASLEQQFQRQLQEVPQLMAQHHAAQSYLWVWQRALEYSYQVPLQRQLTAMATGDQDNEPVQVPALQAVFCIDVRSEPMRRALETQSPSIQTIGFAGFFGLPIDYSPIGSDYARPQLPGLLKPAIRAAQLPITAIKGQAEVNRLRDQQSWQHSIGAPPSSFALIEAQGLFKAFNLLKNSLLAAIPHHNINQLPKEGLWQLTQAGGVMDTQQLAGLAAGILQALGLTKNFSPRVLLLGHGSCSANNPQAAALDCGACGGQTGEVNARVLAQILNSREVRAVLVGKGIMIPPSTQFIAGLHNTTTDNITCYGLNRNTHGHNLPNQDAWLDWLTAATSVAQAQRIASLVVSESDNHQSLAQRFGRRSKDWAQLRPEWGLANNAAFIVAPRSKTRHLNLQGRSFLHDYQWQGDPHFAVLELIMTAPMVVTNWINLQYYASVTDNLKYGSGNKLLHNVVGGHIGVFEGNGGDLRGGLSVQSLHDGQHWRHQPVRLSVYIDAPKEAITHIINKHGDIAQLIENQWLFLFQLDPQYGIWQFAQGQWHQISASQEML
jgi:uncharacterized protein YbcC (UPF0753/DUF2309 family)